MLENKDLADTEYTSTPEITPASICSSYSKSIIFLRWAGALIDILTIAAIFLITDVVLGNKLYQSILPVLIVIAVAYFPLAEGLTGRSLGKLVTKTIVVNEQGRNPGIWKGILRTIPRLIEINPLLFGGIPGGIAILVTKKKQRLGDMLAKTYVLRSEDLPRVSVKFSRSEVRVD